MLQRWSRDTRFEIDARALRIRGTLYGRRIRRDQLRVDQARQVNLRTDSEYTHVFRTNGIGPRLLGRVVPPPFRGEDPGVCD